MIPASDFSVYPELTQVLPFIEEDFFQTPLTEEEREITIHSRPKTSSMNYNPQPLNDTASITVKKTNYSFYGIQNYRQCNPGKVIKPSKGIGPSWDTDSACRTRYQIADASRGVEFSHLKEASRVTTANPALSQAPAEYDRQEYGQHQHCSDERSCLPDIQESNRKDPDEGTRILKPTILDTEEGSRALTHSRPPKTKSQCGRKEIQDGYAYIHQQNDRSEGFPDVTRPPRCVHIHFDPQAEQKVPPLSFERVLLPVTHPAIRATTEPVDLHEDPLPSSIMCQVERNSRLALGACIQVQSREVVDYAFSVDHTSWNDDIEVSVELHRQGPIDFSFPDSWDTDATPTIRTQEKSSVSLSSWMSIVRLTKPAIQNLPFWKNQLTKPLLNMDVERQSRETAYQNKETVDGVFFTEFQEFGGSMSASQFRKHSHTLLCQEIRVHYLPGTSVINRKDMISLLQDRHPPKSDLCFIRTKSSGCPQQNDSANRVVSIAGEILRTELELVSGQKSTGTERPDTQLDKIRQSVLLSTLECDGPGISEGAPRASHNDSSDTNMEIHDLVPRYDGAINSTATPSSSNNCSAGSKKQKVTALRKQALELDGLEYQQRFLKTQDLCNYVMNIFFPMNNVSDVDSGTILSSISF
ncbi:hypothetical protein AYI70_g7234 [Smittium culicis]|uniref:Uncharacterized protein n=1 Tax=Smittium culicis TaxID=133412 RepID=A0A1R1XLK4_9FUNG|nr:hypothetical protein AYI70_g7234 [Smittium culicis]